MASNNAGDGPGGGKSTVQSDVAETPAQKSGGGLLETLRTIIYAVLIALVVRTVAYEPFNIPSG